MKLDNLNFDKCLFKGTVPSSYFLLGNTFEKEILVAEHEDDGHYWGGCGCHSADHHNLGFRVITGLDALLDYNVLTSLIM